MIICLTLRNRKHFLFPPSLTCLRGVSFNQVHCWILMCRCRVELIVEGAQERVPETAWFMRSSAWLSWRRTLSFATRSAENNDFQLVYHSTTSSKRGWLRSQSLSCWSHLGKNSFSSSVMKWWIGIRSSHERTHLKYCRAWSYCILRKGWNGERNCCLPSGPCNIGADWVTTSRRAAMSFGTMLLTNRFSIDRGSNTCFQGEIRAWADWSWGSQFLRATTILRRTMS